MIVGSLFAGIGGFDLAAEALGWRTAWFVENNPHCQRWLAEHFPDRPIYGDIRTLTFTEVAPVDVLCGGFPCQPHSAAGKRGGSDDDRELWPEFRRAIGALRPRYVVAENVSDLLTSDDGRMFNRILSDLAALGYDARWDCLSAAECGAPHNRDRIWLVAWLADAYRGRCEQRDAQLRPASESGAIGATVGHAPRDGWEGRQYDTDGCGRSAGRTPAPSRAVGTWSDAVAVIGGDGTCRLVPRDAAEHGIESSVWPVADGVPGRVARLAAVGNAVVPAWCLAGPFRFILDREASR